MRRSSICQKGETEIVAHILREQKSLAQSRVKLMVSCGKWKYDSLLNFFETLMESRKVLKDVWKADS